MSKECYEVMSHLMVELMNTDQIFTYNFFVAELHISRSMVSSLKRGRDLYIHHYLRVINCIIDLIQLTIFMVVLLKQLRKVLTGKCDLVVGTISHEHPGQCEPEEWKVVLAWMRSK